MVIASALACLTLPTHAQCWKSAPKVTSATLLGFGELSAENIRVVEQKDLICRRRGLMFGIRYVVQGRPAAALVTIKTGIRATLSLGVQ